MSNKKLYILDVSSFVFRAYFALPPMTNREGMATHAVYGFVRAVLKLFREFEPQHIVAVFDGPDNKKQRKEIYEKYKANRTQVIEDLPEQMELSKAFCDVFGIAHVEVAGVEADDTIGSIAKKAAAEGLEVYMCTSDKDMAQLVDERIFLLNTWKDNRILDAAGVEEVYGVRPDQIIDLLAIMGDSSDNIPGLYGFGPKTAVSLLKEFGTLDEILAHPDKVKGAKKQETLKNEADTARLSRRLATIHTDVPFTHDATFFAPHKADKEKLKAFYTEMGFNSLLKEIKADEPQVAENYILVNDEKALDALITELSKEKEMSFDVETTSLKPLEAQLVGIGFCVRPGTAYYVPLNGKISAEYVLERVKPLFENSNIGFYGHNVKYDAHVLQNFGIDVATISFDTLIASFLLHAHMRRHSLDELALHHFGKVKTSIKSLIGTGKKEITMDQVEIEKVSDYCCEDVDYTCRLKELLEKELKERKLEPLLFDLELPLTRVLLKMERAGMFLDVPKLERMSVEIAAAIQAVEEKIFATAGQTFNINSPKQLSKVLFEDLGLPQIKKTSTRAEVLEQLAIDHPIAREVLEFRSLEKLRSTYIDTLPNEVNPKDHRVHPTFTQWVAATGRLSCQDPNLQNIPVRTPLGRKIREAFRPQKEGWSYLSADYSQIELRLLAHLSEDPTLVRAFNQGEDIHAATAALMFGVALENVSKTQRHHAKAINFGIIYGQQAYGLAQELGIPMKEAAAFIEGYFERYPRVFEFVAECIKKARQTGKTVTMTGRERTLTDILSNNAMLRMAAERLAINTPLQGSAADLIKEAMLTLDRELSERKMKSFLVLQVHDELIFEAPDEELEALEPLVKEVMEGVFKLKVPLVVDTVVGKNWGAC